MADVVSPYPQLARRAACVKCPALAQSRSQIVEDSPHPGSPLVMIIGEAPGADEDRLGRPFVGASGEMIRSALRAARYDDAQRDYYFSNSIRCHPHRNRNPKLEELENCRSWLTDEVTTLQPRNILCLGRFARRQMDAVRRFDSSYPIPIWQALHPGAAIYGMVSRAQWHNDVVALLVRMRDGARPNDG